VFSGILKYPFVSREYINEGIPECIMNRIKFVGHISKQGNKRMVIIPNRFHERVDNEFKDNDLTVEIGLTFDEDKQQE
jgi:hypothetical protein